MKKLSLFVKLSICFITILSFCSCSIDMPNVGEVIDYLEEQAEGKLIPKDEYEVSESTINQLVEALSNKDKDVVRALFAKTIVNEIDNFDDSIDDLFDFYQGELVSFTMDQSFHTSQKNSDHKYVKYSHVEFEIITDKVSYDLIMQIYITDENDQDNEGIHSLRIMRQNDYEDSKGEEYWGDYLPGISFYIVDEEDGSENVR